MEEHSERGETGFSHHLRELGIKIEGCLAVAVTGGTGAAAEGSGLPASGLFLPV